MSVMNQQLVEDIDEIQDLLRKAHEQTKTLYEKFLPDDGERYEIEDAWSDINKAYNNLDTVHRNQYYQMRDKARLDAV
jgi:hypothetical protein